jgi:hypothetical protein
METVVVSDPTSYVAVPMGAFTTTTGGAFTTTTTEGAFTTTTEGAFTTTGATNRGTFHIEKGTYSNRGITGTWVVRSTVIVVAFIMAVMHSYAHPCY